MYTQIIIKKVFLLFFSASIRISEKNINFGDKKIKKSNFYKSKKLPYKNKEISTIDDIDVSETLVSKGKPYSTKNSFKYFIGYSNNDVIRPLCIKLPQRSRYVEKVEDNTKMSFKITDSKLL